MKKFDHLQIWKKKIYTSLTSKISEQMSGVKNETYLVLQICKIGSDVVKQVPKFGSKAIIYTF